MPNSPEQGGEDLFGDKPKQTYEELLEEARRKPFDAGESARRAAAAAKAEDASDVEPTAHTDLGYAGGPRTDAQLNNDDYEARRLRGEEDPNHPFPDRLTSVGRQVAQEGERKGPGKAEFDQARHDRGDFDVLGRRPTPPEQPHDQTPDEREAEEVLRDEHPQE